MDDDIKPVEFRGRSLDELRDFPDDVRAEAGHQIYQVQCGLEPTDWKAMPDIGAGVREIRVRDASGIFRVIYVANLEDAVFVLHCFQKKTEKTSKRDIDMVKKNFKELLDEYRS
jgi:phage-related protein